MGIGRFFQLILIITVSFYVGYVVGKNGNTVKFQSPIEIAPQQRAR